jgi:dihydrofolate reductase
LSDIALIVAVAENGVIGAGGRLPWRLSTDLRRFKRLTLGKPVVMGRATFAEIGKALPGRRNIVVTRQAGFSAPDVAVAGSLEAALALAAEGAAGLGAAEIMVIGGGEIFAQAIAAAGRLYVTHVHASPAGDAFFPPIDPAVWRVASAEAVPSGPQDSAATTFTIYDRRSNSVQPGG